MREFYFSDSNVDGDSFMKSAINEREDRYVPAECFMKFKRIISMNATIDDLIEACAASKTLEVDRNEKLIRSKKPFVADPRRPFRVLAVKGFEKTETLESLQKFFRETVGPVNKITMRKLNAKGTGEKFFCGNVDVEVPTEEIAAKLVEEGIIYNGKQLKPILGQDLKKKAAEEKNPRKK